MAHIFLTHTITFQTGTVLAGARTRAMVPAGDRADRKFHVLAARGAG